MRKMSAVSMLLFLAVGMFGCDAAKQAAPPQQPPPTLTIAGNWAVTVSNAVCSTSSGLSENGFLNTCSIGDPIGSFNIDLEPFQPNDGSSCEIPSPISPSPWEYGMSPGPNVGDDCGFANIDGYGSITDANGNFPAAPWDVMLGQGGSIVQNDFNAELVLVFTNGDLWAFNGVYLDNSGTWTATGVIGPCANVGEPDWHEWPITTPDCSGATYPTMIVNAAYVGPNL